MGRAAKFILDPILEEPSEELDANITEALLHCKEFIVKKYKNHARVWCGECNSEENISLDLLKQVRKAKTCPFCHSDINIHREQYEYEQEMLVRVADAGYYYKVSKKINQKPRSYHKQVAIWADQGFYARNIYKTMYNWNFVPDRTIDKWYPKDGRFRMKKFRLRNTMSYNSLAMDFWVINNLLHGRKGFVEPISRKEYLEGAYYDPDIFKSNQKKILMDYHLNFKQMDAIRIFDLKSYKEVAKYSSWINKQHFGREAKLNIYYLDYLARNNISYWDFTDYLEQCKKLNIKPGKPKNFYETHTMLNQEIAIMSNKKQDAEIKKYAISLMKKAYKEKEIVIRPLKDVADVIGTGAQLHNCIKMYIDKYAKRSTCLFVLEDKGVKKVAIEVRKKELIQARADQNRTPDKKYKKIIDKWMESYAG